MSFDQTSNLFDATLIVYFWFIFDCFIYFHFISFQNQKDKEDEEKNETQQRIINSLVF